LGNLLVEQKIHTLGYGFLSGNHKHFAKLLRLLVRGFFFLRFLDFGCFESVPSKFIKKTNKEKKPRVKYGQK
jgi:hypothetical protein